MNSYFLSVFNPAADAVQGYDALLQCRVANVKTYICKYCNAIYSAKRTSSRKNTIRLAGSTSHANQRFVHVITGLLPWVQHIGSALRGIPVRMRRLICQQVGWGSFQAEQEQAAAAC